jgi:uncharacterized protein (TIGR03067 family)
MLAVAVLVSSAALSQAPGAVDAAALKKLQGKWQLTAQEHGGKKAKALEVAAITLEVRKEKFVIRDGVDVKEDASVVRLDGKGKPAAVDLKITAGADLDKVVKAVWKLEGDALTVCTAEPGKDRPREFKAAEGSGHTLLVFKRLEK